MCGHILTCVSLTCKFVACICFFLFLTSALFFFWAQSLFSFTERTFLMFLLHHHAAAELLLSSQTQLLHVGVGARGRAHAPHRRFGQDGEAALCCGLLLLLLEAGVRMRLLADVQTLLEQVGGRSHRGKRGAAGGRGRAVQGLLPGAVLQAHRGRLGGRQGGLGGGVEHGGGSKHCGGWRGG